MILFILSFVLAVAGSAFDLYTSRQFVAYGIATETSRLNRDKYGYFSTSRFIVNHAVFLAVPTLLFLFTGEGLFGLALIVLGVFSIWQGFKNQGLMKRSRERDQIPVLEALAPVKPFDMERIKDVIPARAAKTVAGRMRFVDFPWLYLDNTDADYYGIEKLKEAVYPELWRISQKPRSEWFSDTQMRKLN